MVADGKVERSRDPITRAPALLLAFAEAAIRLGEHRAGFDDGDPKLKAASDEFSTVQHDTVETLAEVCKMAHAYRAINDRPRTLSAAILAVTTQQKLFELAIDEYLTRLEIWRDADAQGSRIRVGVVARLQKPVADGGAGLSYTAADKAASADPEYTQHKDACNDLANMKDRSEKAMNLAETSLRTTLRIMDALNTLQQYPELEFDPSARIGLEEEAARS